MQEDFATVEVTEQGGQTTQMDVSWTKEDISTIDRVSGNFCRFIRIFF
jgi:hypothetical protein